MFPVGGLTGVYVEEEGSEVVLKNHSLQETVTYDVFFSSWVVLNLTFIANLTYPWTSCWKMDNFAKDRYMKWQEVFHVSLNLLYEQCINRI